MRWLFRLRARIARDQRGAAVMEFAILAPVMVMLLMGAMDLSYQAYVRAVLEGAMQKAGRDSGIEGATAATIDAKVKAAVFQVARTAEFTITRKAYSNFSNIRPERFTDTNGNGIKDATECYDDINANRRWDADPGIEGQGGANDVTLYTITAVYPRMFPLARILGWSGNETVTVSTLLKNQPFATQAIPTVVNRCT